MTKAWSFDSELTQSYTRARQAVISEFLDSIRGEVNLQSAIDVGCGVGYFSKFLHARGLQVLALDGREENANEGHRRYPEITFLTRDVEDPALPQVGTFDLVLCVGLLYHLENPFRAIRNLHALTSKLLIVESMCAPGAQPELLLLDEGQEDNQGLNYVAFYPTESCLAKMLFRAGFPFVYAFQNLPDHPFLHASMWRRKMRTMLVASRDPLRVNGLEALPDIRGSWEILSTSRERFRSRLDRVAGLFRKFSRRVPSPNSEIERH